MFTGGFIIFRELKGIISADDCDIRTANTVLNAWHCNYRLKRLAFGEMFRGGSHSTQICRMIDFCKSVSLVNACYV